MEINLRISYYPIDLSVIMKQGKIQSSFLPKFDTKAILWHIESTRCMFKKLALVFLWFLLTPLLLLMTGAVAHNEHQKTEFQSAFPPIAASQIDIKNNVEGIVISTRINDTRPYIVSNFLKKTELEPYANYMVETADKYDIDFRLIPAIAMKESGGGNAAPEGSYNAWGFENGKTRFTSWESAIDRVGKTLKERYISKGLTTPDLIMPVYAPPAIANGGGWAKDINFFFSKMETL